MKVELTPKEPMTLKVRYNGKEIFSKELVVGVKFDDTIDTPDEPGVAEAILVIDGNELPIGQVAYSPEDQGQS